MIEAETERAVIGGVLVHPRVLVDVGSLAPEHFHDLRHAAIWKAIKALDADQQPVDALSVYAQMESDGSAATLKQLGDRGYFADLMASVVTVENIDYHARRLRLAAKRRSWRALAVKIAADAADASVDAEEFVDRAEREFAALVGADSSEGGPRHLRPILKDLVKAIERRSENGLEGGVCGVPSGLKEIDRMTLGFQPGDFIVVAGRPSMGKTALAMHAVRESSEAGFPSLVFSMEMTAEGLAERLVASQGGILSRDMRTGRLTGEGWIRLHKATSDLSVRKIEIDERGSVDIGEIRRTARHWRARQKSMGVVVIDYLQLIASSAGPREENRAREVAIQSRALKLLAKEIACPIVALAQLNRGLESRADKRPMMSDLKESGAIEQDADVIAFIYRDQVYNHDSDPTAVEINVAKQRNGPTGVVDVKWNALTQRFSDSVKL